MKSQNFPGFVHVTPTSMIKGYEVFKNILIGVDFVITSIAMFTNLYGSCSSIYDRLKDELPNSLTPNIKSRRDKDLPQTRSATNSPKSVRKNRSSSNVTPNILQSNSVVRRNHYTLFFYTKPLYKKPVPFAERVLKK